MKVSELIAELSKYPENMEVVISKDVSKDIDSWKNIFAVEYARRHFKHFIKGDNEVEVTCGTQGIIAIRI